MTGSTLTGRDRNAILVVDDEEVSRSALADLVRDEGFKAIEAPNGRAALDYLLATPIVPRLILLDLNMPVMSGWELLGILRVNLRFAKIPVVLVTGDPPSRDAPNEMIVARLGKPFLIDELLAVLRRHVPAEPAKKRTRSRRPQATASPTTLGDLLYADRSEPSIAEDDWVRLVHSIAAGEHQALRALYGRIDGSVFTLALRISRNRKSAEEVTLDVFDDVWRRAAQYDPKGRSVVGWIMNQARSTAIDRLRFEQRKKRVPPDRKRPAPDQGALRPPTSLWGRLAERIRADSAVGFSREAEAPWTDEPQWKEVAPGITCKVLATDAARERVSMLVRLAPGVAYPPHTHAGVEELHLLDGELWIDDRKLYPGDYSRAEPGTGDSRVWSETGCTCVLLTSPRDILR